MNVRMKITVAILFVLLGATYVYRYTRSDRKGDYPTVSELFSDGAVRKLVLASENGDADTIDQLVKSGVDVNARGKNNVTPLLRSLLSRNKEGYSRLLEHGANPNVLDRLGTCVMNKAAEEEDSFWLTQAIKHGGNPNIVNTGNPYFQGLTPLFYAITKGRTANVKVLIAAKADLNHVDERGVFPLLYADGRQAYDIVYALVEAGADFRQKDRATGKDLTTWVSQRSVEFIYEEHQKEWFFKTVDLLKKLGAEIK